jgi:pSer/pThr/pTyr-binding forkhead associated (FHA) protein
MRRVLARIMLMSGIGAGAGSLAALIAYEFREPEHLDWTDTGATVLVDEMTLSNELWAVVGLGLLGALVCGGIAVACVSRKGLARMAIAFVVAAPLGGFLCWGARWLMDAWIYASLGGPETRINAIDAANGTLLPWALWQIGCGFALSMPIALGIGPNRFTLLRGLLGSVLVMTVGYVLGIVISIVVVAILVAVLFSGGDAIQSARIGDVMYLFTLGASAGIAFGIAETVYKPAWLRSVRGSSEGRKWTLSGQLARIGSAEGIDVYLPPDGTIAPIHAQIQSEEDAHFIVDLAGGLTVNGTPAQSAWLKDGDQFSIGSTVILYRNRIETVGKERPSAPKMHVHQSAIVDSLGNRHLLHSGVNVVGREAGCDVALTWEPSVSRRHAEVVVAHGSVTIRDLGSTNGTFVDGQQTSGIVRLEGRVEIVFGRCKSFFEP